MLFLIILVILIIFNVPLRFFCETDQCDILNEINFRISNGICSKLKADFTNVNEGICFIFKRSLLLITDPRWSVILHNPFKIRIYITEKRPKYDLI